MPTLLAASGRSEQANTFEPNLEETLPQVFPATLESEELLRVVATTSIIGDVAANVGGANIDLTILIERGMDPHGYEPVPSALAAIETAHVVLINGYGLEEGFVDSIRSTAKGPVVPVSAGIDIIGAAYEKDGKDESNHDEDADHGPLNPHVWFDPKNVIVWTENITRILSDMDPKNGEKYRERGDTYINLLDNLDAALHERIGQLSKEQRKLVTDHHLLDYFARAYEFEIIETILPGGSTSTQTSARRIAQFVQLLDREKLDTIFLGSTTGTEISVIAESIAAELGPNSKIVRILTGGLSSTDGPGHTYIRYMTYNVSLIVDSLR